MVDEVIKVFDCYSLNQIGIRDHVPNLIEVEQTTDSRKLNWLNASFLREMITDGVTSTQSGDNAICLKWIELRSSQLIIYFDFLYLS